MNSKICSRCKCEKPLHDFSWRWRAASIRQAACRECRRLENQLSYRRHAPQRREKQRQRNQHKRDKARQFLQEYLAEHACADCGENDSRVLEIDLPSDDHLLSAGDMIARGYPIARIQSILERADIRCANCRRRHNMTKF